MPTTLVKLGQTLLGGACSTSLALWEQLLEYRADQATDQ